MAALQGAFAPLPDARLVSFTVDPVHDTPDVLTEYARNVGADKDRLVLPHRRDRRRARSGDGQLQVGLQDNGPSRPGEEVTHSLHFVLVDKAGRIRGYFDGTGEAAARPLKHA